MNLSSIIGSDDVKKLKKSSDHIVSIFTKTVNELKVVNTEIDVAVKKREDEITKLSSEKESLAAIKTANEKGIDKLNSIFE